MSRRGVLLTLYNTYGNIINITYDRKDTPYQ